MNPNLIGDGHPPAERVRRAGAVAWALLGLILLLVVIAMALWFIRDIFPPMVLALMLIFFLNPLVSALQRRGMSRGLATTVIYLVFIGVLVIAGIYVFPLLGEQFQDLRNRFPELQASAIRMVDRVAATVGVDVQGAQFQDVMKRAQEGLFGSFGRIKSITSGVVHIVLTFVLAPIFALYLLIDLPKLSRSFKDYLPPRYHDEWLYLLERCGQALGGFFRGQLLVAGIVGIMSSIAFALLDLPFWLPLGLLAGFFNIIPLVGPFIGGSVAAIVGAVTGGPQKALFVALAMLAVQQIDNHFISPNVMGRAVRLHPVSVMVALLAGGTLAGLWGMLLAVPAMAISKIVGFHYYETRILGRLPAEPGHAGEGIIEDVGTDPSTKGLDGVNGPAPDTEEALPPPGTPGSVPPESPAEPEPVFVEPQATRRTARRPSGAQKPAARKPSPNGARRTASARRAQAKRAPAKRKPRG